MGRLFPGSGIHEVEPPNLGPPPGSKPTPPEFTVRRVLVDPVTRAPSGFRPILTRRPVVSRRKEPEPLDYGTDIITIHDINRQNSDRRKSNPDTFTRTVSSTLQVKNNNQSTSNRGRVFDDVIYDYPGDGDNFKASETSSNGEQNRRLNRGQQLRWTRVTDSPSRYFYDVSPSGNNHHQQPNSNHKERHSTQESKRDFWIISPENTYRFY